MGKWVEGVVDKMESIDQEHWSILVIYEGESQKKAIWPGNDVSFCS